MLRIYKLLNASKRLDAQLSRGGTLRGYYNIYNEI